MLTFKWSSRVLGAAMLVTVSGCLAGTQLHTEASPKPELRPELFFAGVTHGVGILEERGKAAKKLRVEGMGRWDADSTFRLDQKVVFDDGTTESRTWYLRQQGAHTYTGKLSDASGIVTATTNGNVFHLRYLLRQPAVYMEQELYLQRDGRTVLNVATVSVLGVPWARLSETITRESGESQR